MLATIEEALSHALRGSVSLLLWRLKNALRLCVPAALETFEGKSLSPDPLYDTLLCLWSLPTSNTEHASSAHYEIYTDYNPGEVWKIAGGYPNPICSSRVGAALIYI